MHSGDFFSFPELVGATTRHALGFGAMTALLGALFWALGRMLGMDSDAAMRATLVFPFSIAALGAALVALPAGRR